MFNKTLRQKVIPMMHLLPLLLGASSSLAQNQTLVPDHEDGIQTRLTPEEAARVGFDVQTLRTNIQTTLEKINGISLEDSKAKLLEAFQHAVINSNGKPSETLSRYILNRSVKVLQVLESESHPSLDEEVALLIRSAKLAISYASSDINYLNNQAAGIPFGQFGVDFTEFLLGVNESTLAPQVQLEIGIYALALFRKDLNMDARSKDYQDSMSILGDVLDHLPGPLSDVQAAQYYKKLRLTYRRSVEELAHTTLEASHLNGMTAIVLGQRHSCAIVQGYVFCWGSNDYGQLGNGARNDSATPVQVVGISGATALALGERHTCAIAQSQVYCWGFESVPTSNTSSQMVPHYTPYPIQGLSGATAIAAHDNHTCAVSNGLAYCWGENFYAAFPNPGKHYELMKDSNTPILFPGAKNVTSLALGVDHTCLIAGDKVLCAGNSMYGGIGRGMDHGDWVDRKGEHPKGFGKSEMIAEFANETCTSSDGHIFCWGNGIYTPIIVAEANNPPGSSLSMNFHCTSYNGMNMCWDQNLYRSTVANSSWRMDNQDLNAIDAIQALDLGLGYVTTVDSSDFGTCVVINLASGNQQLYCSQGTGLNRITFFDHMQIHHETLTPATIVQAGPGPNASKEEHEAYADFLYFQHAFRSSNGSPLTQADFDELPDWQKKGIRTQRKRDEKTLKYMNGQNESYEHPVKCTGKRLLKMFSPVPFGNPDC